jgi:hypothetical protein
LLFWNCGTSFKPHLDRQLGKLPALLNPHQLICLQEHHDPGPKEEVRTVLLTKAKLAVKHTGTKEVRASDLFLQPTT